jgi:hypothetical protein
MKNGLLFSLAISFSLLLQVNPSPSEALLRLKASTPKEITEMVYNNVIAGNDRLTDIENYMSAELKHDYKKAIKTVKRGGRCNLPRVLTNAIFSQKINGFNIEAENHISSTAEVIVYLDTGAKALSPTSPLIKFDPKIYSKITITFVRRFIDWKIDNIRSLTPDLEATSDRINYLSFNLKDALKHCTSASP